MSEPKLHSIISECINDNLKLGYSILSKLNDNWSTVPQSSDLDLGITYLIQIWLQNTSSEMRFANIKLTIAPPRSIPGMVMNPKCLELYSDEKLTRKLAEKFDTEVIPTLNPNTSSIRFGYFFKVVRDLDLNQPRPLLYATIHADVLPRGNHSQHISWKI